jgi:uncharacterized protein YgbK (DUF1537 family)
MNEYFLADDLSGALEVAAAFHNAGRKAIVIWSTDGWAACGPDDVVGFDTETRNSPPARAAAGVTQALREAGARGRGLLFNKIDSTMRGPVAAELGAVAEALPDTTVLFTPANPHAGRTVRDGVLLVNGVPVAQTDFGRDPVMPVKESSIRGAVPARTAARVIALDVTTDADFVRAIEQRERAGGPWMAVGSGALARVLVPRLVQPDPTRGSMNVPLPASSGGVLLVSGSAHPLNRAQAAKLTAQQQVAVHEINPSDPNAAAVAATASLRASGVAGLQAAARGTGGTFTSDQVLRSVTVAVTRVAAETGVRRLMVTGGETARALSEAWGIQALRVLGDVEPGLVLAVSEGAKDRWLMAIKPGGFGSETTWVKAADALRSAR